MEQKPLFDPMRDVSEVVVRIRRMTEGEAVYNRSAGVTHSIHMKFSVDGMKDGDFQWHDFPCPDGRPLHEYLKSRWMDIGIKAMERAISGSIAGVES